MKLNGLAFQWTCKGAGARKKTSVSGTTAQQTPASEPSPIDDARTPKQRSQTPAAEGGALDTAGATALDPPGVHVPQPRDEDQLTELGFRWTCEGPGTREKTRGSGPAAQQTPTSEPSPSNDVLTPKQGNQTPDAEGGALDAAGAIFLDPPCVDVPQPGVDVPVVVAPPTITSPLPAAPQLSPLGAPQSWLCCGILYEPRCSRCGECSKWRGGKRKSVQSKRRVSKKARAAAVTEAAAAAAEADAI